MTARRWIIALAVVAGLVSMHGITASTAAAASPCGMTAASPHHHATDADHTAAASAPTSGQAHAGALCLAVLVLGIALHAAARWRVAGSSSPPTRVAAWQPSLTGRAPPDSLLPLLCISRT